MSVNYFSRTCIKIRFNSYFNNFSTLPVLIYLLIKRINMWKSKFKTYYWRIRLDQKYSTRISKVQQIINSKIKLTLYTGYSKPKVRYLSRENARLARYYFYLPKHRLTRITWHRKKFLQIVKYVSLVYGNYAFWHK